ncbi:MAG: phage tail protein [Phascolarctobacterium sp.]|nr:MAG: phage tail protein [Phascolarctobacterium sp.]
MADNKYSLVNLTDPQRETAKAVYERLKSTRDTYTKRAEDCAAMTIPSLFPKESDSESTDYMVPNQSLGARGVNNLSSKLLLALLPPNSPFFRLSISDRVLAELSQQENGDKIKQEIDQALLQIEQRIIKYIESRQIRVTIKEALNQLIVAGNCLLFLPPKEGGAKLYRLSSYVLQRDALGEVIQIVAADNLSFATLPDNLKTLVASDGNTPAPETPCIVYTHIYRDSDTTYKSYQELNGTVIQGSEQTYPKDKTPWIALRLIKVDGESYGRSFVEEYLGDLENYDAHSEALRNFAAITSHIIFLVNPAGITQPRLLSKAKSGDYVPGRPEDVQAIQLNKLNDLSVTKAYLDGLEQRLSYVFMLNSAVQRNAERVTAEEIRYVAGELEDTLGGTYSILSQELQLPLVRRLMAQLETSGEIPTLPDGAVNPTITTGLEALGRGQDLNKLIMFKDFIAQIPEASSMIKLDSLVLMVATALGLDTTGLIKTPQEIEEERQQAMAMQMAQAAIPNATKGVMDAANNSQQ